MAQLEREYFERRPDLNDPNQLVSFGTSGHRGSPLHGTFTEAHILAITQAICDYREAQGTDGPLYMGKDTHAVSDPAQRTALEVLAANDVETIIQRDDGVTPTPVISRAILVYNRGRKEHLADGIVITPSHNPPRGRRLQVQPAERRTRRHGCDAAGFRTAPTICCAADNAGVKRVPFATAIKAATHPSGGFRSPLRERSAERGRHGRHSRRRTQTGRRSAGRRCAALLGANQRRSTGWTSQSSIP